MTTGERLQGLLAADYDITVDQLEPDARLEDLGIDSLGLMELLFKIEDEFHIQVPTHEVALTTLDDVVVYIDGLVEAQNAGAIAQDKPV